MENNEILNRIYAAVDYLSNLEGQDSTLVIEMSQQMISDLINRGEISSMFHYVKHYCDVYDSEEMAIEIASNI